MRMRKAWAGIAAVAAATLVGALGAAPVPAFAATTVETPEDLAAAVKADGEITLGDNITASITVPEGVTVKLDLNGHTLTNTDGQHTITNNGTLTITGNGTVDNVSHACAAVYNSTTGTATLGAASYTRSKENGINKEDNGGNSYYNILNQGAMTIESGAVVKQDGHYSSLIDNGWYDGTQNADKVPAQLTINGGNFSGGINTIKNDDWGDLTINGGSFSNTSQAAVLNWNTARITNGEFSVSEGASCVIMNGCAPGSESDKGELTIANGTFTASNDGAGNVFGGFYDTSDKNGTVTITDGAFAGLLNGLDVINSSISGGPFSDKNVIKHVAAGKAVVKSYEGFSVKADTNLEDDSLARVAIDGTYVYFDSVEEAKNFAEENGGEVKVLQYVVTFMVNGNVEHLFFVKVGEALGELPEAPILDGHTFDGWYVGDTKIDASYVPTSDVTVTAMWIKNAPSTPSTPATPNTPAAAEDTKPAEAPKKALPQTGDSTNLVFPIAIAGVGVVAIVAAFVLRKRHN